MQQLLLVQLLVSSLTCSLTVILVFLKHANNEQITFLNKLGVIYFLLPILTMATSITCN